MDAVLGTIWEYLAMGFHTMADTFFALLQHFPFLGPVVLISILALATIGVTKILARLIVTKRYVELEKKGDLLEAKLQGYTKEIMIDTLDMLGRLLGASKLMDIVLNGDEMVASCIEEFFKGRYSFSQEG